MGTWALARGAGVPARARMAANCMAAMAFTQVKTIRLSFSFISKIFLLDSVQQNTLCWTMSSKILSKVSHCRVLLTVVLFTVPAGEPWCADASPLCSHVPGCLPPGRRHDPADLCTLAYERTQKETAKVMKSVATLSHISKVFDMLMNFT